MKQPQDKLAIRSTLLAGLCVLTLGAGVPRASAAAQDWVNEMKTNRISSAVNARRVAESAALVAPLEGAPPEKAPALEDPAPEPGAPDTVAPEPVISSQEVTPGAPAVVNSQETIRGRVLYSFQANEMELRAALAAFAKANNLNIVPDNDVIGTVTLDVHDLPLHQMLRALLESSDCAWQEEEGLIRVRNTETRTFTVDYLRMSRNGKGQSSATLSSGSGGSGSGGAGGGGGMMGGGGGMSGGGGGMSGGMGGGGGGSMSGSSVNLTAENEIDFWKELKEEMGFILTDAGKKSMAVNMTAGMVQVTDRPSALKRVENYFKTVDRNVHRQVDIEAKLYDVTLNDQFQFGIDWLHMAKAYGGTMALGGATFPAPIGGGALQNSAVGGMNRFVGGPGAVSGLVFSNMNTQVAIDALKQQGNVEVIAKPRLRTLNNQTALIKVGTETPFFAQTFFSQQSQSGNVTSSGDEITTVTVGTILAITPQVSEDNYVSLDISPVLTSLIGTETSPSGTATAPILDTKQASTLVRVQDGTTVILGGLIQTSRARNDRKIPLLGDIPLLGKLFTGTYRSNQKKELVIFITPRIVREGEPSIDDPRLASTPNFPGQEYKPE